MSLEIVAVLEYLRREVRQSSLLDPLQFLEPSLLIIVELGLAEGEEYRTAEECDIGCRHLLSGHDHSGIHSRDLSLLVVVYVDPRSTCAVPDTFEELSLVKIKIVLVFVQMYQCVRHFGHDFCKRGLGGTVDVRCLVVRHEEGYQRMSHLRLSRTLLAEKIQDRE